MAKKATEPKKATKAICTENGEYIRMYTLETHGDKFIDLAAEFCSGNKARKFETE